VLRGKLVEGTAATKLRVEIMNSKLLEIERMRVVGKDQDQVEVHQGAIVRKFLKADVLFVGETHNDVYRFMRDRVPPTDAAVRLDVAKWCMFNGMREQALAEATAILQFQPGNRDAADLARSVRESLKQFPPSEPAATVKSRDEKAAVVAEPELNISPEAATSFATKVQPILVNVCMDCHSRPEHTSKYKLTRTPEFDAGPQITLANLKATVGQLLRSDPLNSPLLAKAITTHGDLKQPPFTSRQMMGYRMLESWVVLAIGSVPNGPGVAGPLSQTSSFASPGQLLPVPPAAPLPTPTTPPGLPPVETFPAMPPTSAAMPPITPVSPPLVSAPTLPSVPAAPPLISVPPVLPTPSVMPPTVPSQPPIVPSADNKPMLPSIPMPPAVALPSIPQVPSGVQSASGSSTGGQFGSISTPKPPPAGSDEFDPGIFNQGKPK
jgi:hypothetical protein